MAIRSKTAPETSTTVLDATNGERERVFDAYRRWGYLEADLDPLGFLRPVPHSDLPVDSEFAQEARHTRLLSGSLETCPAGDVLLQGNGDIP